MVSFGVLVFDEQFKLVEHEPWNQGQIIANAGLSDDEKNEILQKYLKQYNAQLPDAAQLKRILRFLKEGDYTADFRNADMLVTKMKLRQAVGDDQMIINAVSAIDDYDMLINKLAKRLREWYELYCPEFSKNVADNVSFAKLILTKSKEELMKEINCTLSMGADIENEDLQAMLSLADEVQSLSRMQTKLMEYLEEKMKTYCPNILAVANATIGAKLLKEAGSLKRLCTFPASTVQLLGAESALFRHLTSGARSPKHGHIINHPLVTQAEKKQKGKVARRLADKISIAAKVDYFKGKFVGDKLRKELEGMFT